MKKLFSVMLVGVLLLSACGNSNEALEEQKNNRNTSTESASEETENGSSADANSDIEEKSIDVDKGLLGTTVTLPASLFEGEDMEAAIAEAKADGVDDVTVNADGSVTYKVSRAKYNEMLEESKKSLDEFIEELKSGKDYTSIKDVKHNNSFTEFTLVVDRSAYENSFDGFAAFGLYFAAMFYQIIDGTDLEKTKTSIHIEDAATGDVFSTTIYPDALEEMN